MWQTACQLTHHIFTKFAFKCVLSILVLEQMPLSLGDLNASKFDPYAEEGLSQT
jgi:hypothetical protein